MKIFPSLSPDLSEWALKQPVFFVATAPTYGQHVNVSPKGLTSSTLAVLSPNKVAYIDRTGSGCETIAHLRENGRATIMFMSFGAAPRILRLYCTRSEIAEWPTDQSRFMGLLSAMGLAGRRPDAARAVIVFDVFKVTTSCGYAVPRVRLSSPSPSSGGEKGGEGKEGGKGEEGEVQGEGEGGEKEKEKDPELAVFEDRNTLDFWAAKREIAGDALDYQAKNNAVSLDGLPGLRVARRHAGRSVLWEDARAWVGRVVAQREGFVVGVLFAVLVWGVVTRFGLVMGVEV